MGGALCCDGQRQLPFVKLNIYDVSGHPAVQGANRLFRAVGTGAFHAAVEIYGTEWSYGFTDDGTSGVFCCPPRCCQAHRYRETIYMGECFKSGEEVTALINQMARQWPGEAYDLLRRNCCHFSDALCRALGVGPVPPWVTNLAGAGATVNNGIKQVHSAAQAAAIIAAAKAGDIDMRFRAELPGIQARARDVLTQAGEVLNRPQVQGFFARAQDVGYGITKAAMGLGRSVSNEVQRVAEEGRTQRGAGPQEGYTRLGDMTRGIRRRLTPHRMSRGGPAG